MTARREALSQDDVEEIRRLRSEGWSYKHIGRRLKMAPETAKKYAPFGETTKREVDRMTEFTKEMTEIGWQIVEKLKREGRWVE